jgi:hypothetical protein
MRTDTPTRTRTLLCTHCLTLMLTHTHTTTLLLRRRSTTVNSSTNSVIIIIIISFSSSSRAALTPRRRYLPRPRFLGMCWRRPTDMRRRCGRA